MIGNSSPLSELKTRDGFHMTVAPRVALVLAAGCSADKGKKRENNFMSSVQQQTDRQSDFQSLNKEFVI